MTLEKRLWSKVAKGAPTECWPWLGCTLSFGYGRINENGTIKLAHRVVIEQSIGRTLEPGECVLHSCDNPPCCNPAHLRIGTAAENRADKIQKKRHRGAAGERNGKAKLNQAQVTEIRARYADGDVTQKMLARTYGVTQPMIGYIVRGENWQVPS